MGRKKMTVFFWLFFWFRLKKFSHIINSSFNRLIRYRFGCNNLNFWFSSFKL